MAKEAIPFDMYATGVVDLQSAAATKVGGGRYSLRRVLGRGGMGIVWLAFDERLQREVALKFLPSHIRYDAAALDDLRRETARSQALSHPNIIRIHDLYEAEGEDPFISMEYVDGSNLANIRVQQAERVLTWQYLEPLVRQLCDALEYAHGEGIVHRDLKPANLMVDQTGRLKLADFGIARAVTDTMSRCSITQTSGTLLYMSPQQLEGGLPKRADDIYGVGACLYELLTSKPPFHTGDLLHQVRNQTPKPLAERLVDFGLKNEIPQHVNELVLACLHKDERQRPGSAREILEWLTTRENPRKQTGTHSTLHSALSMLHSACSKAHALLKESNWWFVGGGAAALLIGMVSWAMRPAPAESVAARLRATNQPVAAVPPVRTQVVVMSRRVSLANADGAGRKPRTAATIPPVTPLPPRATEPVPDRGQPVPAAPVATSPVSNTLSKPPPTAVTQEVSLQNKPLPVTLAQTSHVVASAVTPTPSASAPAPTRPAPPPVRSERAPRPLTLLDLVKKGNSHVPDVAENKLLRAETARFEVNTTPQRWRLTYHDPNALYDEVELRFERGQMARMHEPTRLLGVFNLQGPKPMDIEKVKIDSDEAVRIALGLATVASLSVKSIELELERGAGGLPVWKVRLFGAAGSAGQVAIAADDGKVLKDINKK